MHGQWARGITWMCGPMGVFQVKTREAPTHESTELLGLRGAHPIIIQWHSRV